MCKRDYASMHAINITDKHCILHGYSQVRSLEFMDLINEKSLFLHISDGYICAWFSLQKNSIGDT